MEQIFWRENSNDLPQYFRTFVHGSQFLGCMHVNVKTVDIDAKVDKKSDAIHMASRRCQV